jgi:hypothetical protein
MMRRPALDPQIFESLLFTLKTGKFFTALRFFYRFERYCREIFTTKKALLTDERY